MASCFAAALMITCVLPFLGGCIPYNFTLVQGATGTVVSDETGLPIKNANIIVTAGDRRTTGTTGPDGKFFVPPETEWGVVFAAEDFLTWPWTLAIGADGRQGYSLNDRGSPVQRKVRDVGRIRLKSKTRGPE